MSGDINLKLQDLFQYLTESSSLSVSLDETSSNASCSTESQSKGPATRESYRTASQVGKSGSNGRMKPSKWSFHYYWGGMAGTICAQVPWREL